jgi:hypothetical protein
MQQVSIHLINGGTRVAVSRQEVGKLGAYIQRMKSPYWISGYSLGRLSRRLSIPSDAKIATWLGLSLSESAALMLGAAGHH